MVKLWISDKLEPRWNKWPNRDDFDSSTEYRYLNELAKAKEESVPFRDQYYLKRHLLELVDFTPNHVVDDLWKGSRFKANTFIEVDEEVLKPANSATESDPGVGQYYEKAHSNETLLEYINRCECELAVEKYFGLNPGYREKATIPGADYGQIVNLLAMFKEEQLAAANKRIEELEQWKKEQLFVWGPIFAYCDDEANAKRLGIGLGQNISTRILEILKAYK